MIILTSCVFQLINVLSINKDYFNAQVHIYSTTMADEKKVETDSKGIQVKSDIPDFPQCEFITQS